MSFYLATLYEDAKDNTCIYFISLNPIFSRISSNVCEKFIELSPLPAEEMQGQEQEQSFQIPQSSLTPIIKHPVRWVRFSPAVNQCNSV